MATADGARIAFVGLGAMGFGMASNLLRCGNDVTGFDVYEPAMSRFANLGGKIASSPKEAAGGNDFLICMVANAQQAESILFDKETGAVQALPHSATILICSTVPASFLAQVKSRLTDMNREDIFLIDSPVSGGTHRAANGSLTIMYSAKTDAFEKAKTILSHMSERLYHIPGDIGAASNVKMVNQVLAGIHIASACEAMSLAAKMSLNTREVYNIITHAAGNSWMFENRVPHMLENDWTPHSALNIFVKDLGIAVTAARELEFPLPLTSAAEQLYINGASQGLGRDDDAGLVRTYCPQNPNLVHIQAKQENKAERLTPMTTPTEITKVGFVGLGAMGTGMATTLVKSGFNVFGYDVYRPSIDKFLEVGGSAVAAASPADAATGAEVLVIMVQNANQVEDVLFGEGKAAFSLPDGSVIILNSTVPPDFVRKLREKLANLDHKVDLVDAPVSGGVARAASGQLTIIAAATESAMTKASPVLTSMSGLPENLYCVEGGVGAASSVKLINQMLAGIHIAAAAEAMALGAKLCLDTRQLYDIIRNAAGGSWMFENRVPAMLTGDWTPHSMLAIFVKDLGIVLAESKRLVHPAPLSATAHQLYLMGASKGWSQEADSGVVRIWEMMTGVSVRGAS